MKLPRLLLFFCSVAVLSGQPSASLSPDLPKETTRAILENFSGLPPPIGGPIPEAEHAELRKPLSLSLQGGRHFEGTLARVEDEQVYLRLVEQGGEVVLSFSFEDVERIDFPGHPIVEATLERIREGDLTEALPYLESIIGARYTLFPLIPPEKLSFFRALPLAALAVDNPAQAIAYSKAIRPYLTLPDDQDELRDIELLAYYRLELREEAEQRALDWIAEYERFSPSALGFYVLAALQFEAANYEEALYTALRPIVFSGAWEKSYLAPCYSIAIICSHLLDDPIERDQLLAEMHERKIPWKPLFLFRSARSALEELILPGPTGEPLPIFLEEKSPEPGIETPPKNRPPQNFLDPSGLVPL